MGLVRAIYMQQYARVKVNEDLTEVIETGQGTRQGCPLSPLLFVSNTGSVK